MENFCEIKCNSQFYSQIFCISQTTQFDVNVVPMSTIAAVNEAAKKTIDNDIGPDKEETRAVVSLVANHALWYARKGLQEGEGTN